MVTEISAEWRQWIATNILNGIDSSVISKVLYDQNYDKSTVDKEISIAIDHPYIKAAAQKQLSLRKRNWLLSTMDTLASIDEKYATSIDVVEAPPFAEFLTTYYSKQIPVVLTGGVDHWPALKKWTPEFLKKEFGDIEVEIQMNREKDKLFERNSISLKKNIKMATFVDMVLNTDETNDYYLTANNTAANANSLKGLFEDVGNFGDGYRDETTIKTTSLFWFGPKGIFTPLHHDLTNNFLTQIIGRKKITLVPAMQVPNLYNDKAVFSESDFPEIDLARYPLLANLTPIEITLLPGQTLFIPIGWWHCVKGLDISMSISYTNFNVQNDFYSTYPKNDA